MLLLLDANLAPGLAKHLRAAGYDCSHVTDVLPADAADRAIALTANRLGAVLVTKDADFVNLKAEGTLAGALVWLRCGNMSNRRLAEVLVPPMPGVADAVAAGEAVVEVW